MSVYLPAKQIEEIGPPMTRETKVDRPVDVKEFRKALGAFTTGVTIVTTRTGDGKDHGLTANSFNSVSLDPPMVLWSLGRTSSNLSVFLQADRFAVHVLAVEQEALSNQFARSGTDKFSNCRVERGAGDVPLLDGCVARFECRVAHRYEGGDHVIFVGEVVSFDSFERAPLVFHSGRYGRVVTTMEMESARAG
jgi:3-hydroxy-9,10-secoandrosta-1,3,5(10)-triene-9,17-dione monooxygenase reductase component